jgi:proline iminopeptidase
LSSDQPGRPAEGAFTVGVPGGVIAASQTASGPPVLILHGGPGWSDYTASVAAELDDAFSVIRFQQRGLEPSTTSGPFSIEQHVEDAIAVLDAADAGRAYVIGHSWGGHLAMHLAARHQDRLLGLVVVDPLGAVPDGGLSDLGRILTERMSPERAARAQELQERSEAGEATMDDALEGLAIIWPGYFASPDKAPPMPPLRLSPEGFAGTFASINSHFEHKTLERSLPALTIPAVFVLVRLAQSRRSTAWPQPRSSPVPVTSSKTTAVTSRGWNGQASSAARWTGSCADRHPRAGPLYRRPRASAVTWPAYGPARPCGWCGP